MVVDPDGAPSRTPFPAIVGQEELKRVLLVVAANDAIDGALIAGEKGTAKSTAVRALVDLLPAQRAVADCPYGCAPDDPESQCADCRERADAGEEFPVETRPVPLVTLPLGATRDRVVGTLSVADALAGEADFDPGLLARANRGILYVDEVNLLDDHLVDVILDAAASGVNAVERDGISVSHPADFTLIGTMNPEEGDLRPQLRDRFALQATVVGSRDLDERVEIIDRALARETDERAFAEAYADEVTALRDRLATARERLPDVELPREFRSEIAELCRDAGVDGHRGDIATARTAITLAALAGRSKAIESDVREAARYALPHRLQSRPFEDAPDLEDVLEDRFDGGDEGRNGAETDAKEGDSNGSDAGEDDSTEAGESGHDTGDSGGETEPDDGTGSRPGDADTDGEDRPDRSRGDDGRGRPGSDDRGSDSSDGDEGPDSPADADPRPADAELSGDGESDGRDDGGSGGNDGGGSCGDDEEAAPLIPGQARADVGSAAAPDVADPAPETGDGAGSSGGRVRTASVGERGARVRTERAGPDDAIDAAASVRAAATRGRTRVEREDLRRSVTAGSAAATIVFAVDASASMRPAMRAAKGVVLELLRDSYQQRDEVAFVAFAGDDAEVLLPPTRSVTLAARHLKELPTGDRTPLPAGIDAASRLLEREDPDAAVVVLVTDGRANVAEGSPTAATRETSRALAATGASVLVVDAGDGGRAGLSKLVASETGGEVVPLSSLTPDRVLDVVDDERAEPST